MAKEDPLFLPAVRQYLKPFGRIVERYLLRRYRTEGAWRSGTVAFTGYNLVEAYAHVLQDILTLVTHQARGTTPSEQVRESVRKDAAEMASLCLILTDQAGCDLLDREAVSHAVNECSVAEIGEIIGGPGKFEASRPVDMDDVRKAAKPEPPPRVGLRKEKGDEPIP